jgi:hypothetical protein
MEVRPYKQIVVKVDGSRRLTLRNRRFVHELDPTKTSLEDRHIFIGSPKLIHIIVNRNIFNSSIHVIGILAVVL